MSWYNVAEPAGWTWNLPFTIQQETGQRNFRIMPTFNLQTYAGITVTTTYYVDADNGDDSNSGADWDNALQTLNQVVTLGDYDRVYARGTFGIMDMPTSFARDIELISDTGATLGIAFRPDKDNLTYYFENIIFASGSRFRNNSSTGGFKCYFKYCTFASVTIAGVDEFMLFDCTSLGSGEDGLNYDVYNTVITKAVEYNVISHNHGTFTDNQASTGHNGCRIVRIMGEYYDTAGQVIADVSDCKTWCLGIYAHDSATHDNFYNGGIMWLDTCKVDSSGNYDLYSENGHVIYIRDFLPTGYTASGTITAYTENTQPTATLHERVLSATVKGR